MHAPPPKVKSRVTAGALKIAGCSLILLPVATVYVFTSGHAVRQARLGLGALSGLLHTTIYFALLLFFAGGLRHGHEPFITRLARDVRHGVLPPELARYTRRLTWFWLAFCAAQIVTSGLLLAYSSPTSWSLFVSVLNLPLIVVALAGEYLYRRLRYRQYEHETPADFVRVLQRLKPIKRPW